LFSASRSHRFSVSPLRNSSIAAWSRTKLSVTSASTASRDFCFLVVAHPAGAKDRPTSSQQHARRTIIRRALSRELQRAECGVCTFSNVADAGKHGRQIRRLHGGLRHEDWYSPVLWTGRRFGLPPVEVHPSTVNEESRNGSPYSPSSSANGQCRGRRPGTRPGSRPGPGEKGTWFPVAQAALRVRRPGA